MFSLDYKFAVVVNSSFVLHGATKKAHVKSYMVRSADYFRSVHGPYSLFYISRWSLPVGSTQVMAAVQDGPWKNLSSGKKVALAAGLSVGATVGYLVYRHIRSSSGKLWTLSSSFHALNSCHVLTCFRSLMVKMILFGILTPIMEFYC